MLDVGLLIHAVRRVIQSTRATGHENEYNLSTDLGPVPESGQDKNKA